MDRPGNRAVLLSDVFSEFRMSPTTITRARFTLSIRGFRGDRLAVSQP